MDLLLKPQPVPAIEAISPGGWLGSSDDAENSLSESLGLDNDGENGSIGTNIFTENTDEETSTLAPGLSELSLDEDENDDAPDDDAPESELDDEENEEHGLNLG